ncbi:hypothetical protein CAI21_16165 [Alkalilimnicola ehrlichii]|uniref:Metallo-beta-lactamase domain-containing protein n=1 Tax=Alkalilimnicola ehrlichii TaxID=351052 RepID=A0A3E0WNC6_9GAMM|nr:MBL fold metallo-hydrolase [Alkalilimnicola ehrlichii]RFA26815.1 hypothetical protein CAI21_16165 [Alkalilimnicola ehrlichii]RFA33909.1 hypothetical protein CAL65_16290 [Alkalilimnicola ehrlichii]
MPQPTKPTQSARRFGRWLQRAIKPRNPYYDPQKPHHTPHGFRNNYPHGAPTGKDFLRWQWQRFRAGLPKPPAAPIMPIEPDLAYLHANREEASVTWIGHVTLLLQIGGLNVLTDPHFSNRASPFSFTGPPRHQPPGIALADLPPIDVVMLSHSHYDHLDRRSVRALYRQAGGPPLFLLPLGLGRWFSKNVTKGDWEHLRELDWWDTYDHRDVRFTFLPVQHWSSRTLWDRDTTLWGAWAAEHPSFRFFFSGDLGYSQDTLDIGERMGGFDLAAIGIGAYEPRWFMHNQHIHPEEAVRIHRELRARRSLGIHWGTFERLTDEPLDEPPQVLAAARAAAGISEEEFFVVRHGETYRPADILEQQPLEASASES